MRWRNHQIGTVGRAGSTDRSLTTDHREHWRSRSTQVVLPHGQRRPDVLQRGGGVPAGVVFGHVFPVTLTKFGLNAEKAAFGGFPERALRS